MAARRPRRDATESTCDALRELVSAYAPTLRFARGERFYPIRAESWLTHTTAADWPETAGEHGDDLLVDDRRHGTTLVRADAQLSSLELLAGTPRVDRPISLSTDTTDPNAIGMYNSVGAEVFLAFGGWEDPATRTRGQGDYLGQVFSELGAAMDPSLAWEPVELDASRGAHLPHIWIAQPVTPTLYGEVEWAGSFPRWSADAGDGAFPSDPDGSTLSALDGLACITYYVLYPHRHPVADGSAPTRMEGQWEAVSLFFAAKIGDVAPGGRPATLTIVEPPRFVVVSQNEVGGMHRSRVAAWTEVLKAPTPEDVDSQGNPLPWSTQLESSSSVLFVGRGTHAFHFEPQDGTDWDEADPDLDLDLGEGTYDGLWQFLWALLWAAVVALLIWAIYEIAYFAAVAFVLGALGWAALAALAALLVAVIALIVVLLVVLALVALFSDLGSDTPPQPQNEEAPGDGPESGSSTEPAAGDSHGDVTGGVDGGASVPPAGTPNAGSPSGSNTVAADIRVIDLVNLGDKWTEFPPEMRCEHPAWWDYTGGWGVRVPRSMSSGWSSGSRRIDEQRRAWGYFHAAQLVRFMDTDPSP